MLFACAPRRFLQCSFMIPGKAFCCSQYIDLAKPKSEAPHFFRWYLLISENALIEVVKKTKTYDFFGIQSSTILQSLSSNE